MLTPRFRSAQPWSFVRNPATPPPTTGVYVYGNPRTVRRRQQRRHGGMPPYGWWLSSWPIVGRGALTPPRLDGRLPFIPRRRGRRPRRPGDTGGGGNTPRDAYMRPLQTDGRSVGAAYMPPVQRGGCRNTPGSSGAWQRTTSAASLLRKPARAVVCPAGANIAHTPVSLRSTVVLCSQPRNAAPYNRGVCIRQPADCAPTATTAAWGHAALRVVVKFVVDCRAGCPHPAAAWRVVARSTLVNCAWLPVPHRLQREKRPHPTGCGLFKNWCAVQDSNL